MGRVRVEALCISIYRIRISRIPRVPLRNERIYLIIFINFLHDVYQPNISNDLFEWVNIRKGDKED